MTKPEDRLKRAVVEIIVSRERLGRSQRSIAREVGLSAQYYNEIEKGHKPVPLHSVDAISEALSIDPTRLRTMVINDAMEDGYVAFPVKLISPIITSLDMMVESVRGPGYRLDLWESPNQINQLIDDIVYGQKLEQARIIIERESERRTDVVESSKERTSKARTEKGERL